MSRILLIVATCLMQVGCHHGDANARERFWKSEISSGLPRGASSASAASFFKSRGLEAFLDSAEHTLTTAERDVEEGGMVSTSISIVCKFDGQDRLIACTTEQWFTGP